MAMACKSEMKLLSHEEFETVRATHHPEIYQFDLKALQSVQNRLRSERAKLRTLVNRTARVQKGKPDARADNPPANGEHLQKRKQVFAKALKRVNKEVKRLRKFEANAKHMAAAHRALATRRSKFAAPPAGDRTASDGM